MTSSPIPRPRLPAGIRTIEESAVVPELLAVPLDLLPDSVLAGVTTRTLGSARLFSAAGVEGLEVWDRLGRQLEALAGQASMVHARQLHETSIRLHRDPGPGLHLVPSADGHMTLSPGVTLTVALADCVPVFLVANSGSAMALLHAGWRGTAAGILEAGVRALQDRAGVRPDDIRVHLGPAIGGPSYEVSPDVFAALGLDVPREPALLDLRAALARRALQAGIPAGFISASTLDTMTDDRLHSHRRGDTGRHLAILVRRVGGGS